MARTIVYIDGFNLYYRALKPLGHRWMNIAALSEAVLPASSKITAIKYYTARVSGRRTGDDASKWSTAFAE
jgi:hypothetical protein